MAKIQELRNAAVINWLHLYAGVTVGAVSEANGEGDDSA